MPTIAIVGAGPGMGLAIARTFGAHGFDVALISRTQKNLDALAAELAGEGITAKGFAADVCDHTALTGALRSAATEFGQIDVLEYSPVDAAGTQMVSPSTASPADIQAQIEQQLYGAIAATQAVLPAMREAGSGTLLFTTGGGSVDPNPMLGNVNAAAAALRNWTLNLHKELADTGVQATHVAISVWIGDGPEGVPTASADQIAPVYWDLHIERDRAEHVFTG
ncbi:SDR family NAD(P)-dependent oxidoreductase [Gordonia sp. HNM0687]|uniref:SDR family NAD(P)-dependent oxidoreductase n=1 Tax=Gordonia mangrovi TaxID=2665643 RepID=A0A6L7GXZ6_9ACTN|nr:SDR family oxidoreductase [Gordonia mangrovi]MXP23535.1 SDR family NAD(P)-dependent oxidoreductase [Gordonia mangrovi]UVF76570.1 SDR family oxidoreductase [Gordonia mangrovi]